ncbi:conserved hypothetical protein [Frankia canadensis]|uniref:Glycosyltransferase 2-like domain-containing protein n=1 Tax=Frankia canadensis TaxID=1836972 RepID=A0A2I2KZK2_9ACTN|nr:glycosyltransferase family 2 protein [Frankia canadensis]SNQ51093.1 conserved hypothetical protein [Frankia canadensis]SOU58383.1 conserved hypothetical protein [Frankia canadensis]
MATPYRLAPRPFRPASRTRPGRRPGQVATRAAWPVPYGTAASSGDAIWPVPGTVPVTTIILTRDEAPNIVRVVRSAGWSRQIVVVDSGSTDDTVELARAAGATVWYEPWRGFAGQRQWALSHPGIAHDWVYFLDADEWVSAELAAEIASQAGSTDPAGPAAYAHRRRLVFQGRWIAHCGWYTNSWQVRLLDRRAACFDQDVTYGERPSVVGRIGRLSADLIDEDQKGLAAWLHKHVRYAELKAESQPARGAARHGVALTWAAIRHRGASTRPLGRIVARELVFPLLPARPLLLFVYMYLVRGGWRDGRSGLLFCIYHAWYELTVGALVGARRSPGRPPATDRPLPVVPRQRAAGPAGGRADQPDSRAPAGREAAAGPVPS